MVEFSRREGVIDMDKWTEHDYPEAFDALPLERQQRLLDWIADNLSPIQGFNSRHTSYGLKHLVKFDNDEDPYSTNGEFKGAMLKAGYKVQTESALNWVFNVSERSPILKKK